MEHYENVSNNVYLLSRESTMIQDQYSIPRLFSGSLKAGSDWKDRSSTLRNGTTCEDPRS